MTPEGAHSASGWRSAAVGRRHPDLGVNRVACEQRETGRCPQTRKLLGYKHFHHIVHSSTCPVRDFGPAILPSCPQTAPKVVAPQRVSEGRVSKQARSRGPRNLLEQMRFSATVSKQARSRGPRNSVAAFCAAAANLFPNKPDHEGLETLPTAHLADRNGRFPNKPDHEGLETFGVCGPDHGRGHDVSKQARSRGPRNIVLRSTPLAWCKFPNKPDHEGLETFSYLRTSKIAVASFPNKPDHEGLETSCYAVRLWRGVSF